MLPTILSEKELKKNSITQAYKSLAHALYGPLLLAERTPVVLLHPERHAAEMEAVVAFTPYDDAVLLAVGIFLALTLAPETRICEQRALCKCNETTNYKCESDKGEVRRRQKNC